MREWMINSYSTVYDVDDLLMTFGSLDHQRMMMKLTLLMEGGLEFHMEILCGGRGGQ